MTTSKEQYTAYTSAPTPPQQDIDPRESDRRALMNCATRLNIALTDGGKDMKAYTEALRHNQHLWTVFQVALCDPDNPLPRDLKITLLNLSRYVDRTSFRAITEFAPQLLTSLIDINRMVATGLGRKQAQANPPPSVETPPPAVSNPGSVMTTA